MRTTAFLACILLGILTGCAKPESGVYATPFDGQATQWEPPPTRVVAGADGGLGAGGDPGLGGGGSASNLPVCTKDGQGNCCYDGKAGRPSGFPKCGWLRLSPNESTVITAAFKKDQKVTLPVTVTLTSVSPGTFATYLDCKNAHIGFVLSAAGMEEGRLTGDIAHYDLKSDGTWVGRGGGGQQQLVVGRDTMVTSRDGGAPEPDYTLSEGLCAPLMMPELTASIQVIDQMDFTIDGVDYTTNFASNPNGAVTGFYVVITKGF